MRGRSAVRGTTLVITVGGGDSENLYWFDVSTLGSAEVKVLGSG